MTGLLNRLGIVGLSLVAGALIFGVITGGIVVHRLENPAALVTTGGHHDQKTAKAPAKGTEKEDKQDLKDQKGSRDEKQGSESGTKGQSESAAGKDSD